MSDFVFSGFYKNVIQSKDKKKAYIVHPPAEWGTAYACRII